MDNLDLINKQITLDSREVAEMMGVDHWQILRKLDGTKDKKVKGIVDILNDNKIVVADYFIKSECKDEKGENRPCYLFTKMGCEMMANKFNGEKGVLFTAKYVKKFNIMEEAITKYQLNNKIECLENVVIDLKDNMPLFTAECKEINDLVKRVGVRVLGGKKSVAYRDSSLRGKVYADIYHELKRQFDVTRYEYIKRKYLELAKKIVEEYNPPTVLAQNINLANSQISMSKAL